MADLHLVVLAAGMGTRMKSRVPKVLHRVAGLAMIEHVLRAAEPLEPTTRTVVVGFEAEQVRRALAHRPGILFAEQQPQLGTGHALLQVEPILADARGTLLLLSGDVPLIRTETLRRLVETHERAGAALTVLTALVDRPFGYGRIVRRHGQLVRIVEERDATAAERRIREINGGVYALDLGPLFEGLRRVGAHNLQGEYYLPDLVTVYRRRRLRIETVTADDPREVHGINSRAELAEVSRIVRQTKNEELMAAGVTIEDPATTYIDPDVTVGPDTVIHPGVYLEGRTQIGTACEIHSGVRIVDSIVEDRAVIHNFTIVVGSRVGAGARVGPFAHIRPESVVGAEARVGNFVELKKTVLGPRSKANHLTYLGDATIGADVNVGAGTITCNYDGRRKHPTILEDGVFIGSDSQLVAPVRVGRGAYVAAGSTITDDVPPGALAIARARQINKEGWVAKRQSATEPD
jgi:bifunctional UDP-N-acetylglucosamine pyrophosphorylase/glucosamine-1-phosphate N-acetyltransferase